MALFLIEVICFLLFCATIFYSVLVYRSGVFSSVIICVLYLSFCNIRFACVYLMFCFNCYITIFRRKVALGAWLL